MSHRGVAEDANLPICLRGMLNYKFAALIMSSAALQYTWEIAVFVHAMKAYGEV